MYSLAVLGVVIKDGKVLLAKRNDPDNPEFHLKWELPGGGVDKGETLIQTVLREVTEETGLVVRLVSKFPAVCIGLMSRQAKARGASGHLLLGYLCEVTGGVLGQDKSRESLELKWYEFDEAPWKNTLPGTKDLVMQLVESSKSTT